MTLEMLAQLAVGPAGSIIVMGTVLYGIWRLTTEFIIPRIDKQMSENKNSLRELISEHAQDRKVWLDSIEKISDRMDELHQGLKETAAAVETMTTAIESIEEELKERRISRSNAKYEA